jgi:hypothetical protein
LYEFVVENHTDKITFDEVLSCGKEVFLALIGSVTAISQIGKLLEIEGISAGITAIGKFIVRNAGWVTAAIMAADFGICLYHANQS